jgi:phosphatidylserine decarboxylase
MTLRSRVLPLLMQEDLNFLLTNRIPRRLATLFVGWISRLENPLVRNASIGLWRLFSGLDLSDAKHSHFRSMRECFTRELKEGARPFDPDPAILASPCDGIVGACGTIDDVQLYQIKGFPYTLQDLLHDPALVETYRNGRYVTLRLTSAMYHRFHAPYDCRVERVTYISGDTWNVNPIALKRVERLFCKNERAVLSTSLVPSGSKITLVPVAAIAVASIRLHFLDVLLNLRYGGPSVIKCDATLKKGEEMGWFEQGSTIIVFAPTNFALCDNIKEGVTIRAGQALLRLE